ncbi:MAG: hypothetical protein IT462_15650 [Planctomycetes bacterium]|nr:hypothetical protein [Planctomycetota bacterium]
MTRILVASLMLIAAVSVIGAQPADPVKPPVRPAPPTRSFGPSLTMPLPEEIRALRRDEGVAITRLALLFDAKRNKDGIEVEYEGMRTEVPIIYAAFDGKRCDQELSYETWLAREGRGVDLSFTVKTMPDKLEDFTVVLEHLHYQGLVETRLSRFKAIDVELGKPFALRVQGSKPGVNRYRLWVSYKDGGGKVTEQAGFSHWLIVQSPPMFEFTPEAACIATYRQAGENTVIEADTTFSAAFILHHGLSPKDCTVRVSRRGKREMDLSRLAPEVRRVVADDKHAQGWQEVQRAAVDGAGKGALKLWRDEGGFVKASYRHSLSATSAVLPLSDVWEYRFELLYGKSGQLLATWFFNAELKIASDAAIKTAQVKLTWTGKTDALAVSLVEKK